ncbi:Para-hydroxybenzoate--polyprenyltransferase, mitochondrial precursor (PHB:polyprenyltransferase) [Apiotrichum porosum]|uniref:4-hydroxybenzoate polyprenyltransferase, mitochondrial n=1 Tax=Apiotrichum porosum TaxID=105984 RepID=A0A427XZR1_9TREE|nr:Para-hydroxybenzoate--polyprenyltransferase, mitochondrial precursor (PHB:polyprenyltransferase) [Apiotrichum porosum]RSH84364.1 Para-hydroxybenzoate--polyprenyltransferase, mitochondrial precursor (PHB:polyprenyltransferase) [Apiotrichum porosum]
MIPLLARSACARTGLSLNLARTLPARVAATRLSELDRNNKPGPSQRRGYRMDATRRAFSTSRRACTPSPTPSTSSTVSMTTTTTPVAADAAPLAPPAPAPESWVDRVLPAWAAPAKPYLYLLRLDKPTGSILLYWPGAWSITMACTYLAQPITTCFWYLGLFAVGAVVMRGAGCIINDMWDAKMDRKVERTKTRPLAAGEITHTGALAFLSTQMALGLGVLTQLNTYSILLGAASLPLVFIYPFMKRVTYYPQVVLGLCFEWGALLGWAAVAGAVNWAVCAPLYIGSAIYCVAYDTIYAHQDKKDDVTAGVKSTALAWGNSSKPIIGTLYATFVGCLTIAGHAMGAGPLYYAISVMGGAAHLAWQVITVNLDNGKDCWAKFVSNGYVTGPIIWAGMFADYLYQVILPLLG